jgi:flagellar FliL protein
MSQDAHAAPPAKKSRTPLIAGAAIVVLLIGGGGAYWKFSAGGPAEPPPPEPPVLVQLESFVVNLADPGGARFLRLSLSLLVEGEHSAKEFEEDPVARARVRSAILEQLAQLSAETLVTPAGKTTLKQSISEIAGHQAEHLKISDVVFSEFIVQ